MVNDTSRDVMARWIARGLTPVQAAALVGHGMQESSLNTSAFNPAEGAFGMIQWRNDRLDNLKRFANDRGVKPTDLDAQMDFVLHEMRGPEARAGSSFLSATDLPSAHAALKRYIRYGDNSDATRLGHASALLGVGPQRMASAAPVSVPGVAPTAGAPVAPAEQTPLAGNVQQIAQVLQRLAQEEPEPLEAPPLEMARPLGLERVKRLLAAMSRGVA